MSKYRTKAGIECTEEECKLIDSFKRLAKKWKKDGKRLWIYSASGTLHVMMHGDTNYNPTPEFTQYGGSNIENSITIIDGYTIFNVARLSIPKSIEATFSSLPLDTSVSFTS